MRYCGECGSRMQQLPTETSWEEKNLCTNAKCRRLYTTIFGDWGARDTTYQKTLPEEEYKTALSKEGKP